MYTTAMPVAASLSLSLSVLERDADVRASVSVPVFATGLPWAGVDATGGAHEARSLELLTASMAVAESLTVRV